MPTKSRSERLLEIFQSEAEDEPSLQGGYTPEQERAERKRREAATMALVASLAGEVLDDVKRIADAIEAMGKCAAEAHEQLMLNTIAERERAAGTPRKRKS